MIQLKLLAAKTWRHFMHDSLYRNSIYLILSSTITATLGAIFWAIAAHIYATPEIGVVVTLTNAAVFLGAISLLGFDNAIIRFLPSTQDVEGAVNTTITVAAIFNIISTMVTVVLLIIFEPKVVGLIKTPAGLSLFAIYSLTNLLGSLEDAVFTARKMAGYVLLRNSIGGIAKLLLAVVFAGHGIKGLFASIALSFAVSAAVGLFLFWRKINLRVHYTLSSKILSWVRFSLANYAGGLAANLVLLLLPLLILRTLGASATAYYFISYTISTGLRFIPQGITQSLFAEGSNKVTSLKPHTLRAIKFLALTMIPIGVVFISTARYLLLIFGSNYSHAAVSCLRILIVVAVLSAVNYLGDTILNTLKRVQAYTILNVFSALSTILFVIPLLRFGLVGVAWGWLLSEISVGLIYVWMFRVSFVKLLKSSVVD